MKSLMKSLVVAVWGCGLACAAGMVQPDLLKFKDGRVVAAADWPARRAEVASLVLPIEYGRLPAAPKDGVNVIEVSKSSGLAGRQDIFFRTLKASCDMDGKPVSFLINIWGARTNKKLPLLLEGDGCWHCLTDDIILHAVDRGWLVAQFNRCEVAADNNSSVESTLAKWAWSYHRAIDALLKLEPRVDPACIAITGHSRGGKTVALAGATDARIAAVGDNCSGQGGSGPCRNVPPRGETIKAIARNFPYWFAPGWASWAGRENELPFDQHFLQALIAPRKLFIRHAAGDLWANPTGAVDIYESSRVVWQLLGKPENIRYSVRPGGHAHTLEDFSLFMDFVEGKKPVPRVREFTCHAGAMGTKDNTMESIKTLAATKMDWVEIDVSFRPSGLPVIIHKTNPTETEGTPLAEVLAVLGAAGKKINFDLKRMDVELLKKLPPMMAAAGITPNRMVFSGVNDKTIPNVRKACKGYPYFFNCTPPKEPGPAMDALIDQIAASGALGANPNWRSVTRTFADKLHARGLFLTVWTANSPETFKACEELDPDYLTTRWVPENRR